MRKKCLLLSILSLSLIACGGTSSLVSTGSSSNISSTGNLNSTSSTSNSTSNSSIGETQKTTSLTIEGNTLLKLNDKATLIVKYDEGSHVNLSFSTSSPFVVSVSNNGEITALAIGKATITVTDKISSLSDSIEIQVIEGVPSFQDLSSLQNYIRNTSSTLEVQAGKIIHTDKEIGDSINNDETTTITHYDDNAIRRDIISKYTNWSGDHEEKTTEQRMIKGNFYYELDFDLLNDSNKSGYKYPIDDGIESNHVTMEEAVSKSNSFNVINGIASDLDSAITHTSDSPLEIKSTTLDNGDVNITIEGFGVRPWADNIQSDCYHYDIDLTFRIDGFIKEFIYQEITYSNDSYDLLANKLKDHAVIVSTRDVSVKVESTSLIPSTQIEYDPTDYFLTEIKGAKYGTDNTLQVGDHLSTYNITITDFAPATALDSEEFDLVEVINTEDQLQFEWDTFWGAYKAISTGTATVVIAASYDSSVTYSFTVNVIKGE